MRTELKLDLPEDFREIMEKTDMDTAVDFAGCALQAISKVENDDLDLTKGEIICVTAFANYLCCLTNERLLQLVQEVADKTELSAGARTIAMAAVIAGQNAETFGINN